MSGTALLETDQKPGAVKRPSPENAKGKGRGKVTRRGLSSLTNDELSKIDDPAASGPGSNVYTNQINIWLQQKKNIKSVVAAKQLVVVKSENEKITPDIASLDEPIDGDKSAEAKVDLDSPAMSPLIFDSPPSPQVSIKKRTQSKKLRKLLRNLENEQRSYLEEKASKCGAKKDCDSLDDLFNDDDDVVCETEADVGPKSITLRIQKHGQIFRFATTTNVRFTKVFEDLADMYKVDKDRILLTLNDEVVHEYDTPKSIGLKFADTIEFFIMDDESAKKKAIEEAADTRNTTLLKVQSKNSKVKIEFRIRNNDPMSKLMEMYANQTGTDLNSLTFNFDGDQIDPDDTPESLELEDGFCIDAIVHS